MANPYYRFKQFTVFHDKCAMKVGTDGVLLGAWANVDNLDTVLDVGSGSGIISLMIAQRCNANILGIEIDDAACAQAVENADNSPWACRIAFRNEDFREFHKTQFRKFDLIISNPPYFNKSLKTGDNRRNHARHDDSLDNNDLLKGAQNLLAENGRLAVIMPYTEGCIFIAEAVKKGLFCVRKTNVYTIPDSTIGRLLLEFAFKPEKVAEDNLVIGTGEHNKYTDAYKNLTGDFYLSF